MPTLEDTHIWGRALGRGSAVNALSTCETTFIPNKRNNAEY
jgi:hypothetical protein